MSATIILNLDRYPLYHTLIFITSKQAKTQHQSFNPHESRTFTHLVRGKNEKEAKKLMSKVKDTILRAHLCVGCGICTGRCDNGALKLEEQVYVDEETCIHCGECLGPCPVIGYGESEFEF